MKKELYNAIFRLFEEGDYGLTIKVGSVDLKLYDSEDYSPYWVWDAGIVANGKRYQVGDLGPEGKGPNTYAELFRGDYDVIDALAEEVYNDFFEEK